MAFSAHARETNTCTRELPNSNMVQASDNAVKKKEPTDRVY